MASGSQVLSQQLLNEYGHRKNVTIVNSEISLSATQARNLGLRTATADIIAFTDDDIVADRYWAENLLSTYRETDAIAVGGRIEPLWLEVKPDYLPGELYWLIGATDRSFLPDNVTETRNVFGPNMSFRKEVFDAIGYFNERLGFAKRGTSYIQGEEAEFGLRIINTFKRGTLYNPDALIFHKVPASKLKIATLIKRAFYQGYSKVLIQKTIKNTEILNPERAYLRRIFSKSIPRYLTKALTGPERLAEAKKLAVLITCVCATGIGFTYGHLRHI